jgi:hemerythrin-like domain-containing protein
MEMKASRQLRNEHEGIRTMLRIMEAIRKQAQNNGNFDKAHFAAILEFLKVFVDKCHHAKEEELLFPALEAAGVPSDGGPIGVMLHEHALGRELVKTMEVSFTALSKNGGKSALQEVSHHVEEYIALLSGHIDKENGILFDLADHMLSEMKQRELLDGFEKIEEERIGDGKHEAFHELIHTLGNTYLS